MNKMVGLLMLLLIQGVAAKELYRFQDSTGTHVTADTISPLDAAEGYEIVNEWGQVLRVVVAQPVELSDLEQRKQDSYLLSSFSKVSDIIQLKDRKMALLTREITNLKSNLQSLQSLELEYLRSAAYNEMAAEQVPESLRQKLSRVEQDTTELQNMLRERQADVANLVLRYGHYEDRLRQLKKAEQSD
ncbi:MAG: hypothetical protein HN817_00640 [Porticoccaceae bacterium]|jgi:hypothetical protein|nr:hypothetical protein [Porticoccaceae bacterium]MBT7374420.1 hypothetical protein [Porticoccaceae bacterium]